MQPKNTKRQTQGQTWLYSIYELSLLLCPLKRYNTGKTVLIIFPLQSIKLTIL